MRQKGFPLLPTISTCAYCGKPITYGAEQVRFPHDRWTYHHACVEPARTEAIKKNRTVLQEGDLLPSERQDIIRGLRELERGL